MWYVYFLRLNNGDIYAGSTNDVRRRIDSHRRGRVNSTEARPPVDLKAYIAVLTERNARELERYFKSGSGKACAKKRFWSSLPIPAIQRPGDGFAADSLLHYSPNILILQAYFDFLVSWDLPHSFRGLGRGRSPAVVW